MGDQGISFKFDTWWTSTGSANNYQCQNIIFVNFQFIQKEGNTNRRRKEKKSFEGDTFGIGRKGGGEEETGNYLKLGDQGMGEIQCMVDRGKDNYQGLNNSRI